MTTTSLPYRDHAIPVFLRGAEPEQAPDTQVLWREELSRALAADTGMALDAIAEFPPLPAELLTAPTRFVIGEVRKIARRLSGVRGVVRHAEGRLLDINLDDVEVSMLAYGTLFLPARGRRARPHRGAERQLQRGRG